MSLRHVILGLVVEQPRHGYALQAELEACFGELCDPGPGEVYRVLGSLSRAGLVSASTVRVGRRPHRKVYVPTAVGRRTLAAWLRDGRAPADRGARDEPWLRILMAARVAPAVLRDLLDAEVDGRRRGLRALEASGPESRRSPDLLALVLSLRHASALEVARGAVRAAELCRDVVVRYRNGAAAGQLLAIVNDGEAGRGARAERPDATG